MLDHLLRKLPVFKGKHRIANFLFGERIKLEKDILVEGKYGCKYLLPNLQENVGMDIFINGIYEPETVDFLLRLIPQNGRFMDLGANIGAILMPLCKQRNDIKAIAVEAAPWIFEYLKKNTALNHLDNVQLLNYALFDKDDEELLFFSPKDKYGKGSLSPVFSSDGIKVMTKKLDSIARDFSFERVDVLKVDVEGFEYFVFKGGYELLHSSLGPHIIFEFVDWAEKSAMGLQPGAAQQLLVEAGYKLFLLDGKTTVRIDSILDSGSCNIFASKRGSELVFQE